MIIEPNIITDLKIESVNDLCKLKTLVEEGVLKVNKSQIGRELWVTEKLLISISMDLKEATEMITFYLLTPVNEFISFDFNTLVC